VITAHHSNCQNFGVCMTARKKALWRLDLLLSPLLVIVLPYLFVMKLARIPFSRVVDRSPVEIVRYIRDFLDGTGKRGDGDAFLRSEIADPRLEPIRSDVEDMEEPPTGEDMEPFEELIERAKAIVPTYYRASAMERRR